MLEILLTVLHPLLGGTGGGSRTRTGVSVGGRGECSSGMPLVTLWCCGTGLSITTKKRSGAVTVGKEKEDKEGGHITIPSVTIQ